MTHGNPPEAVSTRFTQAVFACAVMVLAAEPVVWLVRTWFDPVYESAGLWVFAAVVGIAAWSFSSPVVNDRQVDFGREDVLACSLLVATAGLRLTGHLVAISVLAAASLAIDIWAIGRLARLHRRVRAVSPFWLATLFAFSLPIERIVQRLIGFPLQLASATGACSLLDLGFDGVTCGSGIDIDIAGTAVLVDLPCSGARGLMMLGIAFAAISAVSRPRVRDAFVGIVIALVSAYVSNVLRITALSAGIALGPEVIGVDVMSAPWHDIVGWVALALGVLPTVLWASSLERDIVEVKHVTPRPDRPVESRYRAVAALVCAVAAAALFATPSSPVDVSRPVDRVQLPNVLLGRLAERHELSEHERAFFVRYGGAAARASYGSSTLLIVRTTSPLRHIHAPDECLRGLGYQVERLGVRSDAELPHALYRATDTSGRVWRVAVTYVSSDGDLATSVAEAVYRWIETPGSTWTVYERIQPWSDIDAHDALDDALIRAYELERNDKYVTKRHINNSTTTYGDSHASVL